MTRDVEVLGSDDNHDDQFVNLSIGTNDLGDFITNLLGQREKIEFKKAGTFEITLDWLHHISAVIDQRISQQTQSSMVEFKAELKYEDGTSRTLTTYDSFLHFNELKMLETRSVRLSFIYLVQFPNKNVPEKQEIFLYFNTKLEEQANGFVQLIINHTERTWGMI